MATRKPDPCEYVRNTYGVPARVGMHVTYDKRPGVIKGGSNYVDVLFAGCKTPSPVHPADPDLIYFNDDGTQAYPQA